MLSLACNVFLQVLISVFEKSQYLTCMELDELTEKLHWSKEKIQSWLWVCRALANVFIPEKADQEELVTIEQPSIF